MDRGRSKQGQEPSKGQYPVVIVHGTIAADLETNGIPSLTPRLTKPDQR